MRALRWVLWTAGVVVALIIIAAVVFVLSFDANKYKPELISVVKEKTGRTLTLEGDIGLSLLPNIGASVGRASISEANSPRVFARIDGAHVAVALLPLLSGELVVDGVELRGLQAEIVKHKDGTTNLDDLIRRPPESAPRPARPVPPATGAPQGSKLRLDVSGIRLRDSKLSLVDEAEHSTVTLSIDNLSTGRIADNVPGKLEVAARVQQTQPPIDMAVDGSTGYRASFGTGVYALSGIALQLKGDAPDISGIQATIKGDVAVAAADSRIDVSDLQVSASTKDGKELTFSAPKFSLSPERSSSQAVRGEVKSSTPGESLDAQLTLAAVEARGARIDFSSLSIAVQLKSSDLALNGRLESPLAVDLTAKTAQLKQLKGDFAVSGPSLPAKGSKLVVDGNASMNWGSGTAAAALSATIDDSHATLKADGTNLAKQGTPRVHFDLVADRLDVDRYLPPKPSGGAVQSTPPAAAAPTAGQAAESTAAGDRPVHLGALKALDASGTVRIGSLVVNRLKMTSVHVALEASGGRLSIDPFTADLYEGHSSGSARADANGNALALREQLNGVSLGPLLQDLTGKDLLDGRGTLSLDVTTAGPTVNALKRGLNGKASLAVRDGAIRGIDIGAILRSANALATGKGMQNVKGSPTDKTDFSDLSATFTLHNGVAHNDDLVVHSPILKITGAGDIDIGQSHLDYQVKAAPISGASPIVVPVRASGPFEAVQYQVDVQGILLDAAKEQLQRRAEDALKGQGPLGNAIKDLLRR